MLVAKADSETTSLGAGLLEAASPGHSLYELVSMTRTVYVPVEGIAYTQSFLVDSGPLHRARCPR